MKKNLKKKEIIYVLLQNVEQSKDIVLNLMYLKHTLFNNHGSISFISFTYQHTFWLV